MLSLEEEIKESINQSTNLYLKHNWGGGKAATGFGPDRIGTLVSMTTYSSHRVVMVKILLEL